MSKLDHLVLWCVIMLVAWPSESVLAQASGWQISGFSIPELRQTNQAFSLPSFRVFYHKKLELSSKDLANTPAAMPSVYCFDELAFFCKIEVQIEKKLRFPVKFRLGDVPYVDWMEGKRRTY